MQINSNDKIKFTARNKTIRFADDIARKINRSYPRISPSNVEGFSNVDNFFHLNNILNSRINTLRFQVSCKFARSLGWNELVKIVPNSVKFFKVGNCAEASELAEIAARTNGIQNCSQMSCVTPWGKSYDHRVLIVNDKKPYIIDAWLGFADYVPKAIERYRKEFRHHFDFDKLGTEVICFKPSYLRTSIYPNFYEKPQEQYKALFPELYIKKP